MASKQIKEIIGLALLGEGILGLLYPKKYSLLWKVGPESLREAMEKAAENPELMRLIYAAEAGLGFWLAKS
ncbi:MAG: hypothetical protein ABI891_05600, partial [Acidobacteriota bacterium]